MSDYSNIDFNFNICGKFNKNKPRANQGIQNYIKKIRNR